MTLAELLRDGVHPLVLGHRGDCENYPENTLAAFDSALRDGADGVELDVRLSSDLVPMVIHDATLRRTAGVDGRVSERTAEELSRLDVGSWRARRFAGERIPTLAGALQLVGARGIVAIEIKDDAAEQPGAAARVIEVVRTSGIADAVMLLAFDHRHLGRARSADAGVFTVALVSEEPADVSGLLAAASADGVGPLWTVVNSGLVNAAHGAGGAVVAWTVDDVASATRLAAMGTDVLVTNRPAKIRSRHLARR